MVTCITELVPMAFMVLNAVGKVARIDYGPGEAEIYVALHQENPPERAAVEITVTTDPASITLSVVAR